MTSFDVRDEDRGVTAALEALDVAQEHLVLDSRSSP